MDYEMTDQSFVWAYFGTPEKAKEAKKKFHSYTQEFKSYLLIKDMENSYEYESDSLVSCLLNFIQEMKPSLSF